MSAHISPHWRITGEWTGITWVYDGNNQAAPGARSTPYIGWREDDETERVWVQKVIHGDEWAGDRQHLVQASEIGRLPTIAACPNVVRIIDRAEAWDFYLVSELAQTDLAQRMNAGALTPSELDAIRAGVSTALDAIHAAEHVHCDVQPMNTMLAGGIWKLGDLGGAVPVVTPIRFRPKDARFVHPEAQLGSPAKYEYDWYGLERTLEAASAT